MFSRGHFTAIKFLHAQNFFEKLLAPARGIAYINNPQADMAQLVEHNLAKVGVAGSSPVVRSIACIGPVFESALFISTAKWPSGKAEACKAFTPGSNPGFASRSPKGPSERRAPFRSRHPDSGGAGGAVRGRGHRTAETPSVCPSGLFGCGIRRRRRPVPRCGSRIRAPFQMKQEIPFGTGPRRSKWDFLLHLGSSGDGLSHLISTIFEKLLAPARGIAYINNPQADMAQLVEHNLAKVGVAGSSPVVRSIACIGPVFESALFISTAKWPSGKAEACKAFTPGSNPGFASRSPKGPSERRAPFRSRHPDSGGAGGAVRGRGHRTAETPSVCPSGLFGCGIRRRRRPVPRCGLLVVT